MSKKFSINSFVLKAKKKEPFEAFDPLITVNLYPTFSGADTAFETWEDGKKPHSDRSKSSVHGRHHLERTTVEWESNSPVVALIAFSTQEKAKNGTLTPSFWILSSHSFHHYYNFLPIKAEQANIHPSSKGPISDMSSLNDYAFDFDRVLHLRPGMHSIYASDHYYFTCPSKKNLPGVPNLEWSKWGQFWEDFQYLINAGIVVWRVWILFPENKFVQAMLITLLVGSLNLDIPFVIFIWTGPLLATNVAATLLTGYKAWRYYLILKNNFLLNPDTLTRAQKVLWLLVESGAISCILWIRSKTSNLLQWELLQFIGT
ncbi:hypothetical protein K435DRAFT_800757 [Dendrothele bispora CBS 962.96]|uniref:Uncharacterized protein n=1 Tax=Dendrothele bispora (strain CBS 962.96) TaxID=1314807 RepID=A0A4S8LRN0_DENBC|nr:hypothetical protein K435DRAFT_800757 [Dendrothele bispora CBS 962.96]